MKDSGGGFEKWARTVGVAEGLHSVYPLSIDAGHVATWPSRLNTHANLVLRAKHWLSRHILDDARAEAQSTHLSRSHIPGRLRVGDDTCHMQAAIGRLPAGLDRSNLVSVVVFH